MLMNYIDLLVHLFAPDNPSFNEKKSMNGVNAIVILYSVLFILTSVIKVQISGNT